jgi:two-component system sensor histidine kinase/response regulator
MNWRTDSKQRQFLLLLFLPVALALLLGGVFNRITEQQLQQTRSDYDQAQARDLGAASEASSISLQALMLQQELTEALAQAQSGRIDEAGAYQLHARIVDQVAHFEQRLTRLGQAELAGEQAQALSAAQAEFGNFKRFVLMSTDLASIDTRLAGQHLLSAHAHYVKLALQLQAIDEQLTRHVQQSNAEASNALEAIRSRMLLLNTAATGGVLILWLGVALRLAGRMGRLNAALSYLSEHDDEQGEAPLFSHLSASARRQGLLGDMARAVLAYRDARVQRRAAQEALDTERTQLHALIQGMPDLVWLKDTGGAYRVFNQRFLQQTGRSPEDLLGQHDHDLFPPEEAGLYLSGDQIAIDSGRYELPPHWRQFADGHRELIIAIKTPIRDSQGRLLGVLGVGRDITALHQAQQALADRERQYASIVSQAPVGIVLVDLATLGFISFNDAACQAMGYERDEFTHLTIYDLQASLNPEQVDAMVQRIVAENGLAFENQRRNKQGEVREFWISMRPLQLDGRACLTGIWMDVTERKNTERELQHHREQLEHG